MHIAFLVEDKSGKEMLKILLPKILAASSHTWTIKAYKGVGRIPPKTSMLAAIEAAELASGILFAQETKTKTLLDNLRGQLSAYGKTYKGQNFAVIVVCDLDHQDKNTFELKLQNILSDCVEKPQTRFCLAIEEGEAWILGDLTAIKTAYPSATQSILNSYINDSICRTWEKLADAIYPGGSAVLSVKTKDEQGRQKSIWAKTISPHMNVDSNRSPSFCRFRDVVRALIN